MSPHKQPSITLHYGASRYTANVDGHLFDLRRMPFEDFDLFRALLIEGLKSVGYFSAQALRFTPEPEPRKTRKPKPKTRNRKGTRR